MQHSLVDNYDIFYKSFKMFISRTFDNFESRQRLVTLLGVADDVTVFVPRD